MRVDNVTTLLSKTGKAVDRAKKLNEDLCAVQKGYTIPMDQICDLLANRVEGGEKLNDVIDEIEKNILKALIRRGYNQSIKLAKVLKISPDNTRRILSSRRISLREINNTG